MAFAKQLKVLYIKNIYMLNDPTIRCFRYWIIFPFLYPFESYRYMSNKTIPHPSDTYLKSPCWDNDHRCRQRSGRKTPVVCCITTMIMVVVNLRFNSRISFTSEYCEANDPATVNSLRVSSHQFKYDVKIFVYVYTIGTLDTGNVDKCMLIHGWWWFQSSMRCIRNVSGNSFAKYIYLNSMREVCVSKGISF